MPNEVKTGVFIDPRIFEDPIESKDEDAGELSAVVDEASDDDNALLDGPEEDLSGEEAHNELLQDGQEDTENNEEQVDNADEHAQSIEPPPASDQPLEQPAPLERALKPVELKEEDYNPLLEPETGNE